MSAYRSLSDPRGSILRYEVCNAKIVPATLFDHGLCWEDKSSAAVTQIREKTTVGKLIECIMKLSEYEKHLCRLKYDRKIAVFSLNYITLDELILGRSLFTYIS